MLARAMGRVNVIHIYIYTSMNPTVFGSAKSEEMGAMEMVAVLFPWRSRENTGRRSAGTTVGHI